MGKFSYKKRKGTRKQSFKNRKRIKKGGGETEEKKDNEPAPEIPAPAPEIPAPAPETPAPVTETPAPAPETPAPVTETPAPAPETPAPAPETPAPAPETPAPALETPAPTAEQSQQDWKEGLSPEAIEQAEKEVTDIEGKANDEGELEPDEIDKLVKQLAEGEDVPAWAKALANSGAAGTAAKILNKNPKLRDALIEKGIEGINNADVSGAVVNTGANTSAPGTAASPEGSYTSDDAGYQKFIENVKTNPEILKNVIFVNAGLSQIFLKQGDSWTEIKK